MVETKYGIISDVHEDPRVVPLAIDVLKIGGAEKLLVNGDIGRNYDTLYQSRGYTAFILDSIGKSELEAFVLPGSHETLLGYDPVIKYFAGNTKGKYSNIVDVLKVPKVEVEGRNHTLVFLPGSDFVHGGEYLIGNSKKIPTGNYVMTKESLNSIDDLRIYEELLMRGVTHEIMHYTNMNDLRKYVRDPERTILICHVPRKFDNLEEAVDMAKFGEASIDFLLNGNIVEKGSIFPLPNAQEIANAGFPVALRKENRGNTNLRDIYNEIGITKAVTGHFHESVHRACNTKGNHVREGDKVSELFWMASYLDGLKVGILTIKDDCKVQYRNIDLRDYNEQYN